MLYAGLVLFMAVIVPVNTLWHWPLWVQSLWPQEHVFAPYDYITLCTTAFFISAVIFSVISCSAIGSNIRHFDVTAHAPKKHLLKSGMLLGISSIFTLLSLAF